MKRIAAALAFCLLPFALPAIAQDTYPSRSITMIVPFAPGGSTDAIGRIVSEGLRQVLGQTVVVENRAGAGGSIGTAAIADAPPDGYTIGIGTASTLAINPATYKNLTFDVHEDVVPIGGIADVPNIMSVNKSVPAADIAALVELCRANPGMLSYASAGNGSVSHLLGEQFRLATGSDIVHVPYRGAGPALTEVVGGQVEILFDNLPTSLPFVLDGRLRPLAVSGASRVPALPEVPTFAEAGLEDMNWMAFFGLVAPKGTPEPIIRKLGDALGQALALPAIRERLVAQQAIVTASPPEAFKAQIEQNLDLMRRAAAAANIHLE
ncbi:Bug family tripartite tricarboxylate transporter substrate binding protein [Mesorhizobium marinum]|uniref:Bug family tripartite tricarboxylate transporter substrate binding protein n=1 Tax=Mesorhizobium marinum TaxID=3228790 RepID=UPI00346755E2